MITFGRCRYQVRPFRLALLLCSRQGSAEAERRVASYRARVGETFAFAAELDLKRAELAEIEVDLANDGDRADTAGLADDSRAAA
jgi:hypothetical protein